MTLRSRLTRAFVVTATLAGTLVGASPAVAAPNASAELALCYAANGPKSAALPTEKNAYAEALNLAVAAMRQSGKSQKSIDAILATEYGLKLEGTRPEAAPTPLVAGSGNLSVPAPSIYRDTCTGRYSIFATWNWNSIPRLAEDAGNCSNCAVGPVDVMAINLSRDVSDPGGYSATSWGATSVYPAAGRTIGDTSNHGFAMEAQDRFCRGGTCSASDYNMYHGQLVMGIDVPGCGYLTAHSKYGHSRTGTTLTGVSVGIDSIGISWSNSTYGWNKAGAGASNTVRPC
jgi:hypothetical protein